jgi:hypothetical protein
MLCALVAVALGTHQWLAYRRRKAQLLEGIAEYSAVSEETKQVLSQIVCYEYGRKQQLLERLGIENCISLDDEIVFYRLQDLQWRSGPISLSRGYIEIVVLAYPDVPLPGPTVVVLRETGSVQTWLGIDGSFRSARLRLREPGPTLEITTFHKSRGWQTRRYSVRGTIMRECGNRTWREMVIPPPAPPSTSTTGVTDRAIPAKLRKDAL